MTKKETVKIIRLSLGFFPYKEIDPSDMLNAWHEALKEYEYNDVKEAVVQFAKNDRRDYATMPGVGLIIAEIENVKKKKLRPASIVYDAIYNGQKYEELPEDIRSKITPERYAHYLKVDLERFVAYGKQYREEIKKAMEAKQ